MRNINSLMQFTLATNLPISRRAFTIHGFRDTHGITCSCSFRAPLNCVKNIRTIINMNDLLDIIQIRTRTFTYMPHLRNIITSILLVCSIPSYADLPVTSTQDDSSGEKSIDPSIYAATSDRIDTRIYGAEALTLRPELEASVAQAYTPPKAVHVAEALEDLSLLSQGQAEAAAPGATVPPIKVPLGDILKNDPRIALQSAIMAENNREPSTVQESKRAAMSQWLPVQMWENYNDPIKDVPDANHDPIAGIQLLGFTPTAEQEKMLLQTKGGAGFHRAVQRMEDQARAFRVMDDNPITSFFISVVDPGYMALGLLLMLGARIFSFANKQHS